MHDALTASDNATGADLLERIRAEVDTTVGEVRRIIDEFRPAVLHDTGLHVHWAAMSPGPPQASRSTSHCPTCHNFRRRWRSRPPASPKKR
jgi:hypothetical protein